MQGDDLRKTAIVLIAMIGLIVWLWVAAAVFAPRAGGEEVRHFQFNLYSADKGAGEAAMRFKFKMGPFPDLAVCYALGAIGIEKLNKEHPDKDFMGGCENGELLTLRQIAAFALLPKDDER